MDNLLTEYDCVFVRDLTLNMSIGIYEAEKREQQRVIVNVRAYVACAENVPQNIDDVVSYEDMVKGIEALSQTRHYDLAEVFAEDIAELCLKDNRIFMINVRVEKPDIILSTGSVGVEIMRTRSN